MIITGGVHLLDIEWLLSTLFDASLLELRAAVSGGSFFRRPIPFSHATGRFSRSVLPRATAWRPGNYVQSFVRRALDRDRPLRNHSRLARGWRKSKNWCVA
jgi:hypothetical protein